MLYFSVVNQKREESLCTKNFLMGNEAIALGAIAAGVNLIAGYPGTPSSEVLETAAKHRSEDIYVEWSVNEKAALEVAAGASYTGARSLVTMKQVGLNVASDPLMSLEYVGIKGGMVVLVADDPGPISSQTEQDTRHFAAFSKLPCFDPTSAQEACEMIQEAFEYSEEYGTPVFFRPTTRVCHGYASIEIKDEEEYTSHTVEGFVKDSSRWVIFPRLSYQNHKKIEARNAALSEVFSNYSRNKIYPAGEKTKPLERYRGFGNQFYLCFRDFGNSGDDSASQSCHPTSFSREAGSRILNGLDEVLCIEELDPVLEHELTYLCGKYHLPVKIYGKLTGHTANAGENTRDSVYQNISDYLGISACRTETVSACEDTSSVAPSHTSHPPPVLCAGCPHRASFYAVKAAMKGRKLFSAVISDAIPLAMQCPLIW